MRKASAGLLSATALLLTGVVSPAAAAPPAGECRGGTHQAHMKVPHHAPGNEVAHARIPYCPPYDVPPREDTAGGH